jgi:hypothetical protein
VSSVRNIIEIAREFMSRYGTEAAATMDRRAKENANAGEAASAAFWAKIAEAIRMLEAIDVEANIVRLDGLVEMEADPGRRIRLKSLLIEEENKLGFRSEQLLIVTRRIDECRKRIALFEGLIEQDRTEGRDTGDSEQVLRNLKELHAVYRDHHRVVAEGLARSRL